MIYEGITDSEVMPQTSSVGTGSPDKSEGSVSHGRNKSPQKPFVMQEDSFEPNVEGMPEL